MNLSAALLLAGMACLPAWALAQQVSLAGRMGERALLVVDGQAHTVAVGASAAGVKLLRWQGEQAQVQAGDQAPQWLRPGNPVQLRGTPPPLADRDIVLNAGPGGHFTTAGQINGRPVRFMVDTGATLVTLGLDEAQRLGIDLSTARQGVSQTANGPVAVQLITLSSVRLGAVELANVHAAVMPQALPYLLLGNSFLGRFQMQSSADQLRLRLR